MKTRFVKPEDLIIGNWYFDTEEDTPQRLAFIFVGRFKGEYEDEIYSYFYCPDGQMDYEEESDETIPFYGGYGFYEQID